MISPIEIKEKKIILTEGTDVYYFSIWAYQAFNVTGIQVLDFGGIKDLKKYLKALTLLPGYENIETILIARDAETDSSAAVNSITTAPQLLYAGSGRFERPLQPFQQTGSRFPHYSERICNEIEPQYP